jgi:hypothetical protein
MTGRDSGIDALRALAFAGVVGGHWMVTAVVAGPDGALRTASPLAAMPWLAPATWALQTLGLFFFVAGYAAARSYESRAGSGWRWLGRRLGTPLRPLAGFAAAWCLLLGVAAVAGAPAGSLRTAAVLAAYPLWFLAVLIGLGAVTGPIRRLVAARGGAAGLVAAGVLVVTASDAGVGVVPVTVAAAWLVPYALGVALAAERLRGRWTAWALLAGGVVALAGLILLAGYPASAVGVPGAGRSNLNPPSLAVVAWALAQCGGALALRRHLARLGATGVSRRVNRSAMGIYLWHQGALLAVTVLMLRLTGAPVGGLHTAPDGPGWLVLRLLWLPVFAVALWAILRASPIGAVSRDDRDGEAAHPLSTNGCTLSDVSSRTTLRR